MKKRGAGGRGALGVFLCCYYILHFFKHKAIHNRTGTASVCGKPKKRQLRWRPLGQQETPEELALPLLWNPASTAWNGFSSLTAKLESVIFVKQSCPALPATYVRAKHAAPYLLSTSKGSSKAAASLLIPGTKSPSNICTIPKYPWHQGISVCLPKRIKVSGTLFCLD